MANKREFCFDMSKEHEGIDGLAERTLYVGLFTEITCLMYKVDDTFSRVVSCVPAWRRDAGVGRQVCNSDCKLLGVVKKLHVTV